MKRTGRPTKQGARELVDGLLRVAGEKFLQDGYRATTIEAVAAAAGVSKKTIYAQFGDKAGLFRAVYLKQADERGRLVPLGDPGRGRAGLIRRAEAIVNGAFEPHALAFNRFLMREGLAFPELQQITIEVTEKHITVPLTAYFRRELPGASEETLAFLTDSFIHLLLGRYIALVALPAIEDLRAWYTPARIAAICDLFLEGCQARLKPPQKGQAPAPVGVG